MCLELKIIMRIIMQNSININSKYDRAIEEIRNYLDEEEFLEIETFLRNMYVMNNRLEI